MNRIIGIVSRGFSNLGKIRKAIVNIVSQPKDKSNGGIYTGSSGVIDSSRTAYITPRARELFDAHEKEVANKRKIPEELYRVHAMGELIECDQIVNKDKTFRLEIDQNDNYSINRKLSYNKKKTQRRNWSKWKRGNR
ncbi:TPA: hypothetical protein ACJMKJ_005217 [Bacillus wiedmannii]